MTKREKYSYEKVCILKNMRYNVFRVMEKVCTQMAGGERNRRKSRNESNTQADCGADRRVDQHSVHGAARHERYQRADAGARPQGSGGDGLPSAAQACRNQAEPVSGLGRAAQTRQLFLHRIQSYFYELCGRARIQRGHGRGGAVPR